MYLFGYGSLVNILSAQKSFHRTLEHKDLVPVVVQGYEKVWNSIEHVIFEDEEQQSDAVFLNLHQDMRKSTNGVLLKIDEQEFANLRLREKNYACVEIDPKKIQGLTIDEKIYTFMTTDIEKIAHKGKTDCFIPQRYIDLLERGVASYDEAFRSQFIQSYSDLPFEIKDGTYNFSDPIQNKYAKDGLKDEGKM